MVYGKAYESFGASFTKRCFVFFSDTTYEITPKFVERYLSIISPDYFIVSSKIFNFTF